MTYCTNTELTAISGTSIEAATQAAIIAQADREIRIKLKKAGITPPDVDEDLKAASLNLAYAKLIRWNQTNGVQTKSVKVGDITIQDDPEASIAALISEADGCVDDYIEINSEYTAIPTMSIVGRLGVRVGEYDEMTTEEEADY